MRTLSLRGFKSFMSSVSRVPTMSSSFRMRWLVPLNSTSVPAYFEYTTWAPLYIEPNTWVSIQTEYKHQKLINTNSDYQHACRLISILFFPIVRPSPTATTSPPWGFDCAAVGSKIPPDVFSSAVLIFTNNLSPNGLSDVYWIVQVKPVSFRHYLSSKQSQNDIIQFTLISLDSLTIRR